ncbi:methyltransferase domain-containing protein [Luteipulveratus mongoliensis]|uniref:Methyltransferase type 11 domain-containing protein n=1 Tax=Luteipulveratus mongoliensis TaxID=571913 RepID=A0A0K1JKG3_9MICO|nr:methyltransferase domain-containing protein [Luteipulveratus mongoliensis]AKU17197.1 hypothetical protein VV02_17255 [Luteipulveratus mongoliensis]
MSTLLDRLDALDRQPAATRLRQRSYDALALTSGDRVIDVGSGAGRAVAELASRGHAAVGVDPDPTMLSAARQRFPGATFVTGYAEDLPFEDQSVDGVRIDKVLHNLVDPARAMTEMHRVLRRGRRAVAVGQDWESMIIDAEDPDLTRALVLSRARSVPSPRSARALRDLFSRHGFVDIELEVFTHLLDNATALSVLAGLASTTSRPSAITGEAVDAWLADQHARASTGTLMVAVPIFMSSARRQ